MTDPYAPRPQAHPQSRPGYRPLAVRVITFVCGGIAAFILLYLAFVLLGANQDNVIVGLVSGIGGFFAWPFVGIFSLENQDLQAILNLGLATVAYLLVGVGVRTLFRQHD